MCTRLLLLAGLTLLTIAHANAQKLINIDFGAHANPFFSLKTGKAATGVADSDYWNLYSRDGANGEFLSSSQLLNLKLSDGTATDADLFVSGAPGAWHTLNPDPMFESYLYPGNPNISISLSAFPSGVYDIYVYAHGQPPAENAGIEVTSGSQIFPTKMTSNAPDWDAHGWVEGNQYVVFRNVAVTNALSILVRPGSAGQAVINGIQIKEVLPANSLITIQEQPQSVSVTLGSSAELAVVASSELPLSYQWFFNGTPLSNAVTASLQITNTTPSREGKYHVVLSNSERTLVSATASLRIYSPVVESLLNVDFGSHLNPFLHQKTGPAAIGKSATDRWNLYSRDGADGTWLVNNSLGNLIWSDGAHSNIRIDVSNADGAWYTLHDDPMFESYLYPGSRSGNINAVLTDLPSGNYDFYVYAHGQVPNENGVIQLSTDSANVGLKASSSDSNWNSHAWTEGSHYLLFTNVAVRAGERLTISSKPSQSGLAVINGLQIVQRSTNSPTSIVINIQPADATVPMGGTAEFSVAATNEHALYYRWFFNNAPLPGETNQTLRLPNVNSTHVGSYYVLISGGGASVASSAARLQVFTALEGPLLNIDYGAHLNPYLHAKTGPAAVGISPTDKWNLYSRDGTNGAFLNSNRLLNLVWSDGATSTVSLYVTNAAGAWYTLHPDPMFESYLYPIGRSGNIGSTLSNLPAGFYDIYVYAHGQIPGENGVITVSTDTAAFGINSTTSSPDWNSAAWIEGAHYVKFRDVLVNNAESLRIISHPGVSGLAVINGIQIVRKAAPSGSDITVQQQPEGATMPEGSTVELSVTATSSLPLQYQWFVNETILPGATSSILRLENLSHAKAGAYHVTVRNAEKTVTSSAAILTVYSFVEAPLLNIDFGAHQNPGFGTKVGPAAAGKTAEDKWNLYSRDDGQGGWRANGELSNLIWSDGSASNIRLSVTNAAGAWHTLSEDPMFESYLYPLSRVGNVGADLSNLPAGKYDLLVYAHGRIPSENGVIQVRTDSALFGTKTNSFSQDWDPGYWVENGQYLRFSDVIVRAGEVLRITSMPGQSGLSVINGAQLILKEGIPNEFNGTVADWTFEEGTVGAQVNSAADSSGNDHHLSTVLGGGAVFVATDSSTAGAVSVSLPSGSGGFGNALRAADSLDFNLGNQFTLEVSVQPGADNDTWNRGVVVGQDAQTGRLVYVLDYRSEGRSLNFAVLNVHGEGENVSAIIPNDGISHHVAGVYNSGALKIYLDKQLVASKTTAIVPGLSPGGAGRVTLGANDIGGYWFNGILDRVRISRQALAPEQFFPHRRDTGSPLTIVQPLQNITVAEGGTATFQVTATGPSALSYIWSHNDSIIPQETNSTLVIQNVQSANAGLYKVVVTSGPWEATSTASLTVNQPTNSAPVILVQPVSRRVPIGAYASFSVVAAGSPPLTFQWKWDGQPLAGETMPSLVFSNVSHLQAGEYTVEVRNDFGVTSSVPAHLTVVAPDTNAPTILITSPTPGVTSSNRVTFAGTILDNEGVTQATWFRNHQLVGPLVLSNGHFSIPNILLSTGTNTFTIRAYDEAGNLGFASVSVVLETQRAIWLASALPVQEGTRVNLPVSVSSSGEIGALSFNVLYDTNYLAEPRLEFLTLDAAAFTQVNVETPGVIRATYVLPGRTLPAGPNTTFASVRFRTRSVPEDLSTPVHLELQGLYSAAGEPIASGASVGSGQVPITRREYIGDNNANDRLDIADATTIIRMITLLDPIRPWDVTGNDLNQNTSLDAGDIVRVLRAVVNLDPQPSGTNGVLTPMFAKAASSNSKIELTASGTRLIAGEQVKVIVSLRDLEQAISGASFRLEYPANALRLESAAAHVAGALVPQNALTIWNLLPEQDYANQSGTLHFAASTASPWPANNGEIAELTFTVLPAAAFQYAWPLRITQGEAASGLDLIALGAAQLTLIGRDAQSAQLADVRVTTESVELRLVGESGVRYRVESSSDLLEWTEVGVYTDASGTMRVSEPVISDAPRKFYRAIQID